MRDRTVMRSFLTSVRDFVLGYVLLASVVFASNLVLDRQAGPDDRWSFPNVAMATYMILVTAIPGGVGFGLLTAASAGWRSMPSRPLHVFSLVAGALAFAASYVGIWAGLFYGTFPCYLGVIGVLLALVAPGLLLGALALAINRTRCPQ